MKALEILKNLKISPAWLPAYDDITEAIRELESLQNRTCKSCNFYNRNGSCNRIEDWIYPDYEALDNSGFYINGYDVEEDFCCNRYEIKDEQ